MAKERVSRSIKRRVNLLEKGFSQVVHSLLAVLIGTLLVIPQIGFGNPQGGVVAGGGATISTPSAGTMQINQSTNKAIINWQSYNIASQEHVHYQQPNSSSIALNRINPNSGPSQIFGKLTANGQVWLVNPAGIWFGPSAYVNVAGLLATTASISDQDFMAGRYFFKQSPDWNGAVINDGIIKTAEAGLVALVGSGVVNNGHIEANLGTVILAAGSEFTINFSGNDLISFTVDREVLKPARDQNGNPLSDGVKNTGTIIANGGKVLMTARTAGQVLDNAINMSGIAQAKSVGVKNGEIILLGEGQGIVKVSGKIIASGKNSGEKGGKVKVLGNKVAMTDKATIDVSGDRGGGEVLIGGDYQGKNLAIKNAERTFVGSDSSIYADALTNGDGGKVVVWADNDTRFYGNIYARGGALSGDGGFVEVSGKESLDFDGRVYTTAPNGNIGTLLLDPKFLIVQTSGGSAYSAGSNNLFANNPSGTNTITPASIQLSGTAVTLQANTDVIFNDPIVSMANALTVNAGRSILINASISTTNDAITMIANDSNANSTFRDAGAGNITMALGTVLNPAGNVPISLTIGSQTGVFTPGSITLYEITRGSTLNITSPNGIIFNGPIGTTLLTGNTTINANTSGGSSGVTFNAGSSISANNRTITINVNAASGGTGGVSFDTSSGTILSSGGSLITIATNTGGNTTGGSITQTGTNSSISSGGGGVTLSVPTASNSSIGTSGAPIRTTTTGTLTLTGGTGGVFVSNTGNLPLGASTFAAGSTNVITSSGLLTIIGSSTTSGGNVTLQGVGITQNTGTTFDAGSGNLTLDAGTGTLTMTANSALLTSGQINITADNIAINTSGTPSQIGGTTYTATPATLASSITLQPTTAGRTIGLAGGAGNFNLSLAELNTARIFANNVQIGNNTSGLMTINAWTPVSTFASNGVLSLITGGAITQAGALTLTTNGSSLVANAGGLISSNANITTSNKSVSLTGVGFTKAASTNISTGTGNIAINAGTGTLTLNASSLLLSGNAGGTAGTINLTADNVAFNATSQVGGTGAGTGSAQSVIVQPNTAGRTIGVAGGAGSLALSSAALDRIRATNVRIGNSNTGTITIGTASTTWTPAATFATSLLTLDSAATITQTALAPINLGSRSLLLRDSNNVSLTNTSNIFSNLAATLTGSLQLTASSTLTVASLTDDISTVNGITAPGGVTLRSTSNGIVLNAPVTANVSGDAIVLAAQTFTNNAGSSALNPGVGRFLVWSGNPANDNRGGLAYNFKQYNAIFGSSTVLGSGNGFLYIIAPVITPSLTGTVSKVYDGTTTAPVTNSNYSATGIIDGDTVTFSQTTANYDTKHVGTNKNVAVTGISANATNGSATVYGYQLSSTTANANIGVITPASLTITANDQTKTYGQTFTFNGTEFTSS
ncbi:two-partner secretion domain-containing protein, partial [Aquicella lusitana]